MLVQEKVVILCQIKLGVNENPPFYQCARVNARANNARKYAHPGCAMQNQGITLKASYVLLRFIAFHAFLSRI